MSCRLVVVLLLAFVCLARPVPASAALSPQELVLLVRAGDATGRELAEHYAAARGVPTAHILEIDVPAGETISHADFHARLRPALRGMLLEARLLGQVRCLVTFHGVPLKVGARTLNDEEKREVAEIERRLQRETVRINGMISEVERLLADLGRGVPPPAETPPEQLLPRLGQGLQRLQQNPAAYTEPQRQQVQALQQSLMSRLQQSQNPSPPTDLPATLQDLGRRQHEPAARRELRDLVQDFGTLPDRFSVLTAQQTAMSEKETAASFDNELALLLIDGYAVPRWQPNPLLGRPVADGAAAGNPAAGPRPLMVARLDGPTPETVRRLIDDAVATEKTGLAGTIVLDSRGIALRKPDGTPDGYGVYDEALRNAAAFLRANATLPVEFDTAEAIIPAGTHEEIAIYCGWYSLRRYVPPGSFVTGAVGFHVASFEMTTLRNPNSSEWVTGLLRDGIAATVGPTDEPYLSAFPRPDTFFPLLLTGELTLAETYWATAPMTSWRVALVGDPLYRPFAAKPAVAVEDLPPELRAIVRP